MGIDFLYEAWRVVKIQLPYSYGEKAVLYHRVLFGARIP